ncbi:MAG: Acetyltransferase (GNAT) family protein [Candidatus Lokiarchaeum sp. GC14_75]|nr:MAG: Acetyltransferase (GNAT) family protein [Candidatus Lokiarchaeum sp. GC14_75]
MSKLLELYTHLHRKDAPLPEKSKLESIWEEITANPLLHYFVVEHNNKIVSSCSLSVIPNLTRGGRPYGLIENVVTHTEYRRRGFGTSCLQFAVEIAWKNKCYKVMLLTGSKDPSIHHLYEKVGFKKGIKTGFVAKAFDFYY